MSEYRYPNEFIQKAQSRIRKQISGNGAEPKETTLEILRQGMGEFTAQSRFEIDIQVDQKQLPGKKSQGEIVEKGKVQSKIQSYMAELEDQDSLKEAIKTKIESLPLQGFGAENEIIPLDQAKKIYTEQTPCGTCSGQGKSVCNICRGQGHAQCQLCFARGMIQCTQCNGIGEIINGDQKQVCPMCQGRREIFCPECRGQQTVPCTTCQTKGYIVCNTCSGEGVNSTIYTVTPTAKISSDIHLQEMDYDPKTFANKIGAMTLAKGGHIKFNVTEPPAEDDDDGLAYYQDAPADERPRTVYYHATMPWAVANFTVNGKGYDIAFAGYKGAVCTCDPFMDVLLDEPLELIKKAANGEGYVAGLLKQACEYRVSRETMKALSKNKIKNVAREIHKLYKLGLGKQALQDLVKGCHSAKKRITRRPRYIGLGIGLVASTALHYQWFFAGMGETIVKSQPSPANIMFDGLPLLLGLVVTILIIKGAGIFTLRKTMNAIGIQSTKIPPLGTAGLYALIGNIVLAGGFIGGRFFGLY